MSIPTDATHGIDFVIVWDLESLSQKHNVNQPYAASIVANKKVALSALGRSAYEKRR